MDIEVTSTEQKIDRFISTLEAMGGSAGNQRLREALGWQESTYDSIKQQLIEDVTRSVRYLLEATQRLSEEGIRRSQPVPSGSLIMSICATVGRPIETRIDTCIHDGFVVFDQPLIDQFYLHHVLAALEPTWSQRGQTGSQMNLNTRLINGYLIPLPSSEVEQCAIATTLSDMDALLDGLDRLIARKRAIKQATMQQLLTDQTRLPKFSGEWEMKRLGDFGIFLKGSGIHKGEAQSGMLPCVRYGELYTHHHDVIRSFNSYISEEVAQSAIRIRAGDLLFAGSGEMREEIGKCAAFIDPEEIYTGGDIVILRPMEANPVFMGYFCNTPAIVSQKTNLGQGDAVVHISAKALAGIKVYMPEVAEQTAIATVLTDMDTEINALETRRTKTRALKQAMMQELLTGRTRLSYFNQEDSCYV